MKKILSLEGGGCRGIMILVMMKELYGENFKPIDNYHLIAGTSVGALLTGLFLKGYSVGKVLRMFEKWLPVIFDRNYLPWKSKYSDEGIDKFLDEVIGTTKFEDIKNIEFIITTFSTSKNKGTYFKSNKPEHKELRLKDTMRASMAAPYYFPEFKLGDDIYVDGGLTGNNDPSAIAFTEAVKFLNWKNDKIRMDSFGCGRYDKVGTPGFPSFIISKLLRVMDALFTSSTDNVEQTMSAMCGLVDEFSYCRYNPELPKDYALDDLDKVEEMKKIAIEYIRSREILVHKF